MLSRGLGERGGSEVEVDDVFAAYAGDRNKASVGEVDSGREFVEVEDMFFSFRLALPLLIFERIVVVGVVLEGRRCAKRGGEWLRIWGGLIVEGVSSDVYGAYTLDERMVLGEKNNGEGFFFRV